MTKKIIITQPTFLPYAGYFAPMYFVDEIIFLDDVQFEKRSWQQRNKIKDSKKTIYLTVSVNTKGRFSQKINDVLINPSSKSLDNILKSIYFNYKNSNYFNLYYKEFEKIFSNKNEKLIDLNISLINKINEFLDINNNKIILSSSINSKKKKFDLIHDIYIKSNATELLSTIGAKKYFPDNLPEGMEVKFYEYIEKNMYEQLYGEYVPNLSIIDILFNLGPKAKDLIKKNLIECTPQLK